MLRRLTGFLRSSLDLFHEYLWIGGFIMGSGLGVIILLGVLGLLLGEVTH
jgi:hypothetical protein